MSKWVYGFGAGQADGDASMKALLGGKGANLAEMCGLGLAVPPGPHHHDRSLHPLSTRNDESYPAANSKAEVERGLARIEEIGRGQAWRSARTRSCSRCVRARLSPCPA